MGFSTSRGGKIEHRLTFQLPEEEQELRLAMSGPGYREIIKNLDEMLRERQKFDKKRTIGADELRQFITDQLAEQKITIY